MVLEQLSNLYYNPNLNYSNQLPKYNFHNLIKLPKTEETDKGEIYNIIGE